MVGDRRVLGRTSTNEVYLLCDKRITERKRQRRREEKMRRLGGVEKNKEERKNEEQIKKSHVFENRERM